MENSGKPRIAPTASSKKNQQAKKRKNVESDNDNDDETEPNPEIEKLIAEIESLNNKENSVVKPDDNEGKASLV